MTSNSTKIEKYGQAIWLDAITRSWVKKGGHIDKMIEAGDIYGLTSNPSIFADAIANGSEYEEAIKKLGSSDPSEVLWTLMVEDVKAACERFAPLYKSSKSLHGYCSIEVDPSAAHNAEKTVEQGRVLWRVINKPNLMIKVPATVEGLEAIKTLISEGINVNVTLLFSVERYEQVLEAWLSGLEERAKAGKDVSDIASVASFFVSRVDGVVDPQLPKDSPLRGEAAIANARLAYAAFEKVLNSERWAALKTRRALIQRPLWASTSTKDPSYSPVKYVEALIGPHTVNTVPEKTLNAIRDSIDVDDRVSNMGEEAQNIIDQLKDQGINIEDVAKDLEKAGLESFVKSFDQAIETVKSGI